MVKLKKGSHISCLIVAIRTTKDWFFSNEFLAAYDYSFDFLV